MQNRISAKAYLAWVLYAGGLFTVTPSVLLADYISVRDCVGAPRAMQEVETDSTSTVTIQVLDRSGNPAADVKYTLKGPQKTLSSTVEEGSAQFEKITAGDWQLCLKDANADAFSLTKVSIAPDSESSLRTAGIIGGLAAIGGGVAIAIGSSDDNGGSSDNVGSSQPPAADFDAPSPAGGSSGGSHSPSGGGSGSAGGSGGINAAVDDCLEDESPDPLSPIS